MRSFWRFMLYCTLAVAIAIAVVCVAVSVACEIVLRRDNSRFRRHVVSGMRVVNDRTALRRVK